MEDKVFAAMESGANTIRTNAIRLIQTQSAGEPYVRYKNGNKRTGIAAQEGSPPNTDTGNLVKNIQVQRRPKSIVVGSMEGAPYGKWLEYGTSKMGARPWLYPAWKLSEKIVEEKLKKAHALVIKDIT